MGCPFQWLICYCLNILLLHDGDGNWDEEGHGAGMLSLRSQIKLIPDLSNVASEGKLGRRQPDSVVKKGWKKCGLYKKSVGQKKGAIKGYFLIFLLT